MKKMNLKHKYEISMLGSDSIKEIGLSEDKLKITIDGLVSKMDDSPSYYFGLVIAIKTTSSKWKYYTRKYSNDEIQKVKQIIDKIRSDAPGSIVYLTASVKKIKAVQNPIEEENNKLKQTLNSIQQLIN